MMACEMGSSGALTRPLNGAKHNQLGEIGGRGAQQRGENETDNGTDEHRPPAEAAGKPAGENGANGASDDKRRDHPAHLIR